MNREKNISAACISYIEFLARVILSICAFKNKSTGIYKLL